MSKNTFGGINGFQKNKVGSVVGYKFRGEQVYRGYQKNVANPRTVKQVKARTRFSVLSSRTRLFARAINPGYKLAVKGTLMTQRNMAIRDNFQALTQQNEIDNSKYLVSKGNLEPLILGRPNFNTPNTVEVPLTYCPYSSLQGSKMHCIVVVFCESLEAARVATLSLEDVIQNNKISVSVPVAWNGLDVYVWSFVTVKGEDIMDDDMNVIPAYSASTSTFVGSGEVQ